jgi:hypothetical protein
MGEKYYFYEMNSFYLPLLLLCTLCVVSGCDSPDKRNHHRGNLDSPVTENSEYLRPDIFSSSPDKVEGCVGLYTYDSLNITFDNLDVDKGKKIVATKTGEFAFLRLHGKDVYLRYDSTKSGPVDKKTSREVYRGNEYTVVLITQEVRTEGETQWSTGILEIVQGNKHFRIKVKGLSGC